MSDSEIEIVEGEVVGEVTFKNRELASGIELERIQMCIVDEDGTHLVTHGSQSEKEGKYKLVRVSE